MEHQLPFLDDYPNRSIFQSLIFACPAKWYVGGPWKVSRIGRSIGIQITASTGLWIDLMGWVAIIIVKGCIQPKSKN